VRIRYFFRGIRADGSYYGDVICDNDCPVDVKPGSFQGRFDFGIIDAVLHMLDVLTSACDTREGFQETPSASPNIWAASNLANADVYLVLGVGSVSSATSFCRFQAKLNGSDMAACLARLLIREQLQSKH
jgi:hypothetical protein